MSKKTIKLKSVYFTPMTEAEIIKAIESKRKGVFRKITWLTDVVDISRTSQVTIERTMFVRFNIAYDHMKSVKERKTAEDAKYAAMGIPKPRKDSVYDRLKGADGKEIEPHFIVRNKSTMSDKFVECLISDVKDIRTKTSRGIQERFYQNGIEIDPATSKTLMTLITALRRKPKEHKEVMVLPLDKIKEII